GKWGPTLDRIYETIPEDAFEELTRRRELDAGLLVRLGRRLQSMGKAGEALSLFEKAAKLDKDSPEPLLDVMRANFQLKNWDEGIAAFDKALARAVPDGKPGFTTGQIYRAAIAADPQALNELSRRQPDDGHLLLVRGNQMFGARNWKG